MCNLKKRLILWKKLLKIRDYSINYKIFFSGLAVGAATASVQFVQTIKDIIVADKFGTGMDLENFIISFLIPGFLITVLADSIPSALLPVYANVRQQDGPQPAKAFLSFTCLLLMVLSAVVCILFMTGGHTALFPIIKKLSTKRQEIILHFQNMLLPIIIVQTGFVSLCTFFYSQKKFFSTTILKISTPLIIIIFLIFDSFEKRIMALVIGTLSGTCLQFIIIFARSIKYSLFSRINPSMHHMKGFWGQYLPLCFAAALMGGTILIDNSMASLLPAGNLASLSFGNKIVMALLGLSGNVLGTSVLPYFSEMSAKKHLQSLNHSVRTYQKLILKVAIPASALLILLSEPITQLVWQHGNFTSSDTIVVAKIQSLYALQSPFYLMGILLGRAISSIGGNHVLAIITVFNLVLNFLFNFVLMKFFGIYGIALSTSVVYFLSYIMIELAFKRLLKRYPEWNK